MAIYSAVGLRDVALNEQIGQALQRLPFPRLRKLRLDTHAPGPTCWLHGSTFCLST